MDVCHAIVGPLLIVLVIISTPFYLRVLYIFATERKYRAIRCYQIMIQIGIVQCLMGPAWIVFGIAGLLSYDPLGIGSILVDLNGSCLRIETGLSFILAMDRLSILCNVYIPQCAFKATAIVVWSYGMAQFVVLQTPFAALNVDPFLMVAMYDFSKPYTIYVQRAAYYYSLTVSFVTFLLYMVMVAFLFRQQRSMQVVAVDFKQRWILVQALIRYVLDATQVVLFFAGPSFLPTSIWIAGAMMTGYVCNNLFVPPCLYICLNKYGQY
uniref:7TM_GPCR_Srx domain-containing protein n=1 Tax=Steinernema glaseri TaxID=37863 RepID=A0A1I7Z688_9BILA